MKFLEFIFQSFWHWMGFWILVITPINVICNSVVTLYSIKKNSKNEKELQQINS